MKAQVWRRRLVTLASVLLLVLAVRAWQQRDMPEGAAPPLQGQMLDGQPYLLPAPPATPMLVHFWASGCPVCRAEQGNIAALARDGLPLITVAMQSGSPQQVAAYLREQGVSFPVVNDADGRIAASWGVHAVPATFVLDGAGRIRFIEVGYTTEPGLRLRLWLAGL